MDLSSFNATVNASTHPTEARLRDYLSVILRRKWVVLITLVAIAGSTVFYVSRLENEYESYARIVIESENQLINKAMNYNSGRSLSFYKGILSSRAVAEMILDSIGMDLVTKEYPQADRQQAVEVIRNAMSLKKTSYSSFYRFNVQAKSKKLAYYIASIGTEVFINQCREVVTEENRRQIVEINKQLDMIREKLKDAEQKLRVFQEELGGDISSGTPPELQKLKETYAEALAQKGVKEAELSAEQQQLRKLEQQLIPTKQESSEEYLTLRSRLRSLEQKKMRLEELGIRVSRISTLSRQIEQIENQLLQYQREKRREPVDPKLVKRWQELRESVLNKTHELSLFRQRLASYKEAIEEYKKGNPDIVSNTLKLQKLKRTKNIYENIYDFLINKAEEARLQSASGTTGIKVVDLARMPNRPIPKNEKQYYVLSILLGFGLGIGLAFLLEMNDTTLKSNADVERYCNIVVLGTIPHAPHPKKKSIEVKRQSPTGKKNYAVTTYPGNLLTFSDEDSIVREAYRSLRTNLSFVSPDRPIHSLVISSAGASAGKSLTAINLALSYADMGTKTLLVDTDLRRPVLHHIFKLKREPGFTDIFSDARDWQSVVHDSGKENLSVLTAGRFTPNPAELIGSQKMVKLLEDMDAHYDMVLFDSPPLLAITDGALLSTRTDGILLVLKSAHTNREAAVQAIKNLRNVGARLVGGVLNDIDLSHRYSSYGYYKYYYHYYKSKND